MKNLTNLDYAILEALPREGSRMGHHTFAKQVISIVEELGGVRSAQVNGRLRSLKHNGLVVNVTVQPVADGAGWQITTEGEQLLRVRRPQEGATVIQLPDIRRANGA